MQLLSGFGVMLVPSRLVYVVLGTFMGVLFGAIPGLTATLGIALLLPFTFAMDTVPALAMAMGIYAGGMYGGSLTAITIRIPGAPCAAMTMLDGYPLMRRGQGGRAIGHATFASALGGMVGTIVLMFFAPQVARLTINFRSPERLLLVFMALAVVVAASRGSLLKGIIAAVLGMMIATIGVDPMLPRSRFTFGFPLLARGVGLIPAIIGLFAISEILCQTEERHGDAGRPPWIRLRDVILPVIRDMKQVGWWLYVKSALIGVGIGALPGAGGTMASFLAYGEAKRSSRHPEEFGNGAVEGLIASEAANNAVCGGAIIPLVTLGIPGDTVTAIMFGVLLIQGLIPGPDLIISRLDVMAPMFASLFLAKIAIMLGIVLTPLYLRIVTLREGFLYSLIAAISLVGAFVAECSVFQVWLTVFLGILGYVLRKADYPAVPLAMGFVLGPLFEQYLRRSLSLSHGSLSIFVTRPMSLALIVLTCVFIWLLRRGQLER